MTISGNAERLEGARSFVARIPDLREEEPGYWTVEGKSEISYPEGGRSTFATAEQSSYWFDHRNDLITAVMAGFPPGETVVDVGGGNGYVSLGLCRAGFGALVVEPGPAGAECARERGLPVVRAPFELLDIPPATMDAAGLFDVLEHIDNAGAALNNLHAALRNDARLYLTVPAFGWLWSQEDVRAGHYHRYDLASLTRAVTAAGFRVEYATYFFSALVPPVFAMRTVPSVVGRGGRGSDADAVRDHTLPRGPVGAALRSLMAWEKRRISEGRTVSVGTSCLMVARRAT